MSLNPNVLVLSNPSPSSITSKREDKKGRIFLVNVFGRSPPSRSFHAPLAIRSFHTPLAVHRAVRVDSLNESVKDTNKMVVSVIVVDTKHQQFTMMCSKAVSSFNVESTYIISLDERYFYEDMLVCSFEYMDLGSMYNVMVEGYGGCFEEKHVIFVLRQVLMGLKDLSEVQKSHGSVCLSHVYLNSAGNIKLGYEISCVHYDGDTSLPSGEEGWNFIEPSHLWEVKLPEATIEYACDIQPSRADIWRFGVLALELIYGGLRLKTEDALLSAIMDMVEKNAMPENLQNIKSTATGSSHDPRNFYLPTVATGIRDWIGPKLQRQHSRLPINPIPKCKIHKDLENIILKCLRPDAMNRPSLEEVEKDLVRVFPRSKEVTGNTLAKALIESRSKSRS